MHKTRKKRFIKYPRYSGGKELLQKIISENLKYPHEALENGIEGEVTLSFKISSKGEVFDVEIENGIGFGCDEEAVRLVKLIKHDSVKNKGIRVTSSSRIKIPFRLKAENQEVVLNIEYKKTSNNSIQPKANKDKGSDRIYSYTIE